MSKIVVCVEKLFGCILLGIADDLKWDDGSCFDSAALRNKFNYPHGVKQIRLQIFPLQGI